MATLFSTYEGRAFPVGNENRKKRFFPRIRLSYRKKAYTTRNRRNQNEKLIPTFGYERASFKAIVELSRIDF